MIAHIDRVIRHLKNQISVANQLKSEFVYITKREAEACLELAEAQDVIQDNFKEKTGHWTTERTLEHDGEWYCDKCGYEPLVFLNTPFCPMCGAKMEGR